MKKIFLTSGVVLCLACPAFATEDLVPQANGTYLLETSETAPNCSTPKTLKYDNAPTTFYAKWAPRTDLTVTYKPGTVGSTTVMAGSSTAVDQVTSATFDASYTVYTNDSLDEMDLTGGGKGTVLTKAGYTFDGWKPEYNLANGQQAASGLIYAADANLEIEHYSVANPTNVNLTAQWKPRDYTITYKSGLHGTGGDQSYTGTENGGLTFDAVWTTKTFAANSFAEVDGYTFSKWNTAENGTGTNYEADTQQSAWTNPDAGLTLYAIYTANGYKLTYNCDGYEDTEHGIQKTATPVGALASTQEFNVTFDGQGVAALDPVDVCELSGYHIDGDSYNWLCTNTTTDQSISYDDVAQGTNGKWTVAGNVICTVGWEANTIGLAWDAGTGATPNQNAGADQCTYDLGIDVAGAPTKPGYIFKGWSTSSSSGEGYVVFPSNPAPTPGTTVTSEGTSGTSQSLVEEEEEGE